MRYPYLLFDADNTLFDFDAAERIAHQTVCARAGLPFTEENYALYHRCNAELWQDYDRGLCTKEFLLVERFRRYLHASGEAGDPERMCADHIDALGSSAILLPGALALCQALHRAGHRLYLITNAVAAVQSRRFSRSELVPCFEDVFISDTVGCGKPQKAYFDYIFQAVPGIRVDNCLVIGDSLSSDIRGANNAGLPCCWYNPKGAERPGDLRIDYEVRTLEEILPIAGQ